MACARDQSAIGSTPLTTGATALSARSGWSSPSWLRFHSFLKSSTGRSQASRTVLQLEVVQYRLENEYGVQTRIEPLGFSVARWVVGGWPALEQVGRIFNCKTVRDAWDRPVLLFKNEWNLNQLGEDHPDLELSAVAPVVSGVEPIAL